MLVSCLTRRYFGRNFRPFAGLNTTAQRRALCSAFALVIAGSACDAVDQDEDLGSIVGGKADSGQVDVDVTLAPRVSATTPSTKSYTFTAEQSFRVSLTYAGAAETEIWVEDVAGGIAKSGKAVRPSVDVSAPQGERMYKLRLKSWSTAPLPVHLGISTTGPDSAACSTDREAWALELFQDWWIRKRSIYGENQKWWNSAMQRYCTHGGVCYQTFLKGVLPLRDGGIALQIQDWSQAGHGQDGWQGHDLVFFDANGTETATVGGLYYFHLSDDVILVGASLAEPSVSEYFSPLRERVAAVSLTADGTVLWDAYLGGGPMGGELLNSWTEPNLQPRPFAGGLYRPDSRHFVWGYREATPTGSTSGGIRTLDAATGAVAEASTATTRDRLCNPSSDPRPACQTLRAAAEARFSSWKSLEQADSLYGVETVTMTGFLRDHPGAPLLIEVHTFDRSDDALDKEIGNRLLVYASLGSSFSSLPTFTVDGMYYFHRDPDAFVASTAMGTSGWIDYSHSPWYGAAEAISLVRSDGHVLWQKALMGAPIGVALGGLTTQVSLLTRLADGSLMWHNTGTSTWASTTFTLFDPSTGEDLQIPSPWLGRALCPRTPNNKKVATETGSVASGTWKHYGPYRVANGEYLSAKLTGNGNADLYLRRGGIPTSTTYTCRSNNVYGSMEGCGTYGDGTGYVFGVALAPFSTGENVYVSVYGGAGDSSYSLNVEYAEPGVK